MWGSLTSGLGRRFISTALWTHAPDVDKQVRSVGGLLRRLCGCALRRPGDFAPPPRRLL